MTQSCKIFMYLLDHSILRKQGYSKRQKHTQNSTEFNNNIICRSKHALAFLSALGIVLSRLSMLSHSYTPAIPGAVLQPTRRHVPGSLSVCHTVIAEPRPNCGSRQNERKRNGREETGAKHTETTQ